MEQMSLFPLLTSEEDAEDLKGQVARFEEYGRVKRNWENAFQRWSNSHSQDGVDSRGCCGYGSMCDWCENNTYGRPCVRALNAMLREKRQRIDYYKRDFDTVWYGTDMRGETWEH